MMPDLHAPPPNPHALFGPPIDQQNPHTSLPFRFPNLTGPGMNNLAPPPRIADIPTAAAAPGPSDTNSSPIKGIECTECGAQLKSDLPYHIQSHLGSQRCLRLRRKRWEDSVRDEASEAMASLRQSLATRPTPIGNGHGTAASVSDRQPGRHRYSLSLEYPNEGATSDPIDAPGTSSAFPSPAPKYKTLAVEQRPCDAIAIDWKGGPLFSTFPWQMFEDPEESLGFHIDRFTDQGKRMWLRATKCSGKASWGRVCCDRCHLVPASQAFRALETRAQAPSTKNVPYKYLNHAQTVATLRVKADELAHLRTKVHNLTRRLAGRKKVEPFIEGPPHQAQSALPHSSFKPSSSDPSDSETDTPEEQATSSSLQKHGASTTPMSTTAPGSHGHPTNTPNGRINCYQCGALVKSELARSHVGEHILRALIGLREAHLFEQIDPATACGFCGRGSCDPPILEINSRKRRTMTFTCPRQHAFQLKTASKSTPLRPSTNVPVHCTLCPAQDNGQRPAFWKYAMFPHIRDAHPAQWDKALMQPCGIDAVLVKDLAIGEEEVMFVKKAMFDPNPNPVVCMPTLNVPYPSFQIDVAALTPATLKRRASTDNIDTTSEKRART